MGGIGADLGSSGSYAFIRSKTRSSLGCARTSPLENFGLALMGSYLPSAMASTPDDDPSIKSMGGGRRLLNASKSFAGWKCRDSSAPDWVENIDVGIRGEASILNREPVVAEVSKGIQRDREGCS